jgi:hypothetical protein
MLEGPSTVLSGGQRHLDRRPMTKPINSFHSRAVRVFVSSTFDDMQAERGVLVKRVFPLLRKRFESRQVVLTEIDLRWGVTSREQAEGNVLPICLSEIDRCRPYFVGLLGSRYGSLVEAISDEMLQDYPWIAAMRGRSVTEVEMEYGALRSPLAERGASSTSARPMRTRPPPRVVRRRVPLTH